MSDTITATVVENTETITATIVDGGDTIIAHINELARGPAGPAGEGGGGSGAITSETTSDGTADLDLLNVETVNATVTGTLTASHIHGNLAGNVYGHIRAGENLAKGDPVYVSGFHGSGSTLIPIVSKADASNAAKMPAIGIMDAAVANNATGHMVIVGTITELNTNAYTVNAELYVASGGGFTATPPTARAQPVARVERANTNNGAIVVKVNGLSATDATANTLVRRNANGDASFVGATFSGTIDVIGGIDFGDATIVGMTATAKTEWRNAIGIGTSDAPAFLGTNITSLPIVAGTTGTLPVSRGGTGTTDGTALGLSVGSAATLTTARTINGVSFNGSANIGQDLQTTANVSFLSVTLTGNCNAVTYVASGSYLWSSSSRMTAPSNGVIRLTDNAQTDFNRLQFGGTTSAFPSIKRNANEINIRLADDSADAPLKSSSLTLSASTASTTTGTGALVVTGGVGVGGAINVGETIKANFNASPSNLVLNMPFGSGAGSGIWGVNTKMGYVSAGIAAFQWDGADYTTTGSIRFGTLSGTTATVQSTLRQRAAANIQQGAADAASPVAQTFSVQSASGTNIAGANRTFSGSQGTGTGVGGDHIFTVAPAGSSGSSQNALVEAFRIKNDLSIAVAGASTFGGGTSIAKIRHGNATLVAGTVTVTDTAITANSRIYINRFTDGGTLGDSYSITRSAGASFTITSKTANVTQTLDTSVVTYLIIEP